MKKKKRTNECPARDCSGGGVQRQASLVEGQIELLPEEVKTKIKGHQAKRCLYCGCIYIQNHLSNVHTILGFLNNDVLGQGFYPVNNVALR